MQGAESQHNTEITQLAWCATIKPVFFAVARQIQNKSAPLTTTKTDNYAGIEGAQELAEALKVNPALTTLDLSSEQPHQANKKIQNNVTHGDQAGNDTCEEGACALAEALKVNKKLATLELGREQFRTGIE